MAFEQRAQIQPLPERVWDAATGQSLATLAGHRLSVESAQFSPDGWPPR